MKFFLIAFALSLSFEIYAQSISPELQSLIDAENNFAQTAKSKTTREAFLSNLAEDAVVFAKGDAVKGKEFWTNRQPNQSLLFWWPVFADISASGDFGYTTGPYQWSETKTSPPSSFGYYSTVWKRSSGGAWKAVIDLGIRFNEAEKDKLQLTIGRKLLYAKAVDIDKSTAHLKTIEEEYNQFLKAGKKSIDQAMLSSDARIHRSSNFPFISAKAIQLIQEHGQEFEFGSLGIDLSGTADMAYTYGRVTITAIKDGVPNEVKGNYLRVWKSTDGENWKIVLDVIGN